MRGPSIGAVVCGLLVIHVGLIEAEEGFGKMGTAAAQFLKIGVGARAMALGGAYGAMANDATTVYWNPAGMVNLPRIAWTGTYTRWFADVAHQHTGLVVPWGPGAAVGFSAVLVSMDEEEITTETAPRGTGYYWDAHDVAVGLSYARWMTDRFALGVTVKYVAQRVWNESASTFAVDVGTYLNTGYKGLVIGMCFANFGGSLQLEGRDLIRPYDPNPASTQNSSVDARLHTQPWSLPVLFRVGVAMDVLGKGDRLLSSEVNRLTVAIDGNHPNDDNEKLNVGLEYAWRESAFLRLGYGIGYDVAGFAYGGGVRVAVGGAVLRCDYALAPYGELDLVQYLTVGLEF